MITFKNIAGNKFLAVGTIQRKSALNGEKSLTGTLYDGDDVLNKIDKGWSLEFDNEPYIVTYFERNDNDNSVSFDAIHKFFWDMAKNVLYSETSGSHTIKWYLDQIFANTGYSYALNFNPNAIAKDNWGMKNKLSLFNDVITSIEGEFEINGTLVSIFKNIGTDLSTIVRYGFNLSDMTIENDASGFVTYGEGFGAYADQENMTGDRLHVTYTSPLASVYGKLQAEPIDDQRYTIESNLLDAVKFQVDTSFSISVNLSLYDLSVAGYPYKMANVGDWLTAVDENLDFKQRIRIISIDDEFAADGTRISYSVTAGDIGLTKKYQDANASIANKVEDAVISAGQAATDANIALIAANGKNKSYHLNDINDLPKTANEGDLAWVQSGDGRVLYIYTKKADGTYYWEKRIDPEMGEQIEAGVNEAIAQANENTATAIEENNISQQEVMNDIAKSQADLAIKDGDFNNKAQAMADKALSDAKANTAVVAKETLDTATDNLNTAKQSLTADLQKEVSDRTTAVATLDSKAQGYADSAKQDAIAAATTADGTINKKIDETASSLTSKITQNKQDADGKITTAQSTATQALNEVKTKVSQTEYNTKTGQLTTDVNSVTQTANQSKQDIVSINQKDGQQDSRMNTIESDANGTKQTVSQLQAVQGQQSGSISTLQQRADGFDATVTKVDNLAVGSRNLLVNSKLLTFTNGNNTATTTTKVAYDATTNMWHITSPKGGSGNAGIYFSQSVVAKGQSWSLSFDIKGTGVYSDKHIGVEASTPFNSPTGNVPSDWTRISSNGVANGSNPVIIYFNSFNTALDVYVKLPKLESGNIPTDWTPAPEDVDSATAKAQLTADQATTALNAYKTDADGRITKAQSDITQTATQVATKVSQSDYNAMTSELTTKVSTAQQTADSAVTTIGSYKTSNDNRVSSAESKISQNTTAINLRATKTDLDNAKSDYTAKISQINVDINGINSSVNSIQGKINAMGQINQLVNTEFSPDFAGWYDRGLHGKDIKASLGTPVNGSNVLVKIDGSPTRLQSEPIAVKSGMKVSYSVNKLSSIVIWSYINCSDKDGNIINVPNTNSNEIAGASRSNTGFVKVEGITIPDGVYYISLGFLIASTIPNGSLFQQPMLVFNSTIGDYVQGNYNNNIKVSNQQLTIDGITNTVSNQGTNISNLTSRVQTAEGTLSTATNNISGMQTKINQTSNQISQEITDRKTGDSNTLQSAKDFTQSSITSSETGMKSVISQTADGILAKVGSSNLFPNSEFSQSYGYAASGTVNISGSTKYNTENRYSGQVSVKSTSAGYQGYWTKKIPVYGGKKYSASVLVHYTNGGLADGMAMLDIWFHDKDDQRISSASRFTSQVSSPYWVKLFNEGFTAPINAVTVQVSLIVNAAGAGQVATFAQPMVTATEKLQEYTPNDDISSQLSLLKDNWSIGITDNIGAITSGIVGNNNSMSLISKNVIIDSPSTQITGTAWINSAMIKNGSIGTAQIGDASITSAKIISLDVARLTGNVSNFIQSNWNGLYQSTYITSDGMTVSSGTVTTSFGSQGMRITMGGNGGVVIQGSTRLNGTQTGVLIGMNVGSTFTSFGFQSSSNYLYNDEMVILKTGSAAAGDYNIGGGVAFNHNVSFMDNIYMKYGKGFYGKWGDPQQAIFFQTINSGIPAIMHISGAGIAFGHKGDLYMLSHGGYQDFNNSSIKGSYTVDQPWITG
ncbi:phage tail protein [Leuconostoc suionicum]|uniref:phage tail protein n=1 Tax=Leuconostoc suionicum TaxID=1511761 RepID=UPI00090957E0|nr:phage tail protein [Leuconostoc suionicum]API72592.1 hypothetical protein A6B45_07840 [Leuconostoc suionicum]BAX71255.1 hypothetical protein LEUCM_01817 [Leuconostoc suionicum]